MTNIILGESPYRWNMMLIIINSYYSLMIIIIYNTKYNTRTHRSSKSMFFETITIFFSKNSLHHVMYIMCSVGSRKRRNLLVCSFVKTIEICALSKAISSETIVVRRTPPSYHNNCR